MVRGNRNSVESRPIHAQVLTAAQRLCRPDDWTFALIDVVRALPHLNESSVRTHVVSRCCENAPTNHAHKWRYFHRVGHGVYEILPPYRRTAQDTPDRTGARYVEESNALAAIHVAVSESEGWYVAECLEVAVVTQGRTLDETMANLRDALELHLDEEELARAGLPPEPRLIVYYETSALAS